MMDDRDALAWEMWAISEGVLPGSISAHGWSNLIRRPMSEGREDIDQAYAQADIAMRHIEAAVAEERERCARIAKDGCLVPPDEIAMCDNIAAAIRAGSPAPAAPVVWTDIATAPLDTDVMLGWWVTWPERKWKVECGWAGKSNSCPPGTSNVWIHGQATHWCAPTLPEPPRAALEAASEMKK